MITKHPKKKRVNGRGIPLQHMKKRRIKVFVIYCSAC